jgi:hypothetical protein
LKNLSFLVSLFFSFFFLTTFLSAKALMLSDVQVPKIAFVDVDEDYCDDECLKQLLFDGQVFSFLAKYKQTNDSDLQGIYEDLLTFFSIHEGVVRQSSIKVALMLPKKVIGKYAQSITNSVFSYLLAIKRDFEYAIFDSVNESEENILKQIHKIREQGFKYVIAPYTNEGIKVINNISTNLVFYIPTVNYKSIDYRPTNMIFGGIDYENQLNHLKNLVPQDGNKSIISDNNSISKYLNTIIYGSNDNIKGIELISGPKDDFKSIFEEREDINSSYVFLNASVVNSSLILSQLRAYELSPKMTLSTQINYNPLILSLTQYEDRQNLYVAHSSGDIDPKLADIADIFNTDMNFNWVNYSSALGMDYFYTLFMNGNVEDKLFREEVINNQVQYGVKIVKPRMSSFVEVNPF